MNSGFSLIESLVIISIISILSSVSLVALPAARAHQQLVSDTELIKSLLLDSKQRALNQVRPEECVQKTSDSTLCSDVGIVFNNNGSIAQFADTNNNNNYNPGDDEIVTHNLASQVQVVAENASSILFRSVPPSVETYKNGGIMGPEDKATITLTASSGETRTLVVHQFGTIDIK